MTVEVLSRIQFALTLSFHFLFPPMTIGLGLVLVVMQTLAGYHLTRQVKVAGDGVLEGVS